MRDWHLNMAREHGKRGHHGAELRHGQAAAAHQGRGGRAFQRQAGEGRHARQQHGGQASQKVGVRPLMPWPRR